MPEEFGNTSTTVLDASVSDLGAADHSGVDDSQALAPLSPATDLDTLDAEVESWTDTEDESLVESEESESTPARATNGEISGAVTEKNSAPMLTARTGKTATEAAPKALNPEELKTKPKEELQTIVGKQQKHIRDLTRDLNTLRKTSVRLPKGEAPEIGKVYLDLGREALGKTPEKFWLEAWRLSEGRTLTLAATILANWPEWSIDSLRAAGKLPQAGGPTATEGNTNVAADDLAAVPQEYQPTFLKLSAEIQNSLLDMTEAGRLATLVTIANGFAAEQRETARDAKAEAEKALAERNRVRQEAKGFAKKVRAVMADKLAKELTLTGEKKFDELVQVLALDHIEMQLERDDETLFELVYKLAAERDNFGLLDHEFVVRAAATQILDKIVKPLSAHFTEFRRLQEQERKTSTPRKEVIGASAGAARTDGPGSLAHLPKAERHRIIAESLPD